MFIGGLAERPLSGAVVGPTFGCLLGQQFQILKKGDRFWYENNIPPSALSKGKITRQMLLQALINLIIHIKILSLFPNITKYSKFFRSITRDPKSHIGQYCLCKYGKYIFRPARSFHQQ